MQLTERHSAENSRCRHRLGSRTFDTEVECEEVRKEEGFFFICSISSFQKIPMWCKIRLWTFGLKQYLNFTLNKEERLTSKKHLLNFFGFFYILSQIWVWMWPRRWGADWMLGNPSGWQGSGLITRTSWQEAKQQHALHCTNVSWKCLLPCTESGARQGVRWHLISVWAIIAWAHHPTYSRHFGQEGCWPGRWRKSQHNTPATHLSCSSNESY